MQNIQTSRIVFRLRQGAVLLLLAVLLSACSVVTAASGSREPDLSVINVGDSRAEIERELGPAAVVNDFSDGGSEEIYVYKIGDKAAPGRAVMHGALDLLTFFLWEYIAFPMEISNNGNAYDLTVNYNKQDVAVKVSK